MTDPSSRQRRCYIRTITVSIKLENTITGRESQGARRRDEMIGGKPSVVKCNSDFESSYLRAGSCEEKSEVLRLWKEDFVCTVVTVRLL
jgi:hypothetical protein